MRLTNSYGSPKYVDSTKWYLVLNDLVKTAFKQKEITIQSNGESSRDFLWMGDVCSVTEKLLHVNCENETFNLSSGKSMKVIDLALMIKNIYAKRYNKDIKIKINKNDTNQYPFVEVNNNKLLKQIEFNFTNHMIEEINNIFSLLENGNLHG